VWKDVIRKHLTNLFRNLISIIFDRVQKLVVVIKKSILNKLMQSKLLPDFVFSLKFK